MSALLQLSSRHRQYATCLSPFLSLFSFKTARLDPEARRFYKAFGLLTVVKLTDVKLMTIKSPHVDVGVAPTFQQT
jgi:hypothetical protein